MTTKKTFSHLPNLVIPINYDIWLQPCFKSYKTVGRLSIQVQVRKATTNIELNCVEIEINGVKYFDNNGLHITCKDVKYSTDKEKVYLSFSRSLQISSGTLVMDFKGELNDKMKGFYRSKYSTFEDEEEYAAVTQFEPTDARRCFPCWDEPSFKATFNVTLVVPKHLVALSNMNIVSESVNNVDKTLKTIKFAQTPVMSTYLLAFVVGKFAYIENTSLNGIALRVYAPDGKQQQGKFALEMARKVLLFYQDYFGIAYPLPKLDLVAISDFSAGAMENWGLITYREASLLIDDTSSSTDSKQWVAMVVAHEIAHQWFGNLVTMQWWTHLWLNEGFATFMQYLATDHCHPEFHIWTQFVSDELGSAMHLDALDNSHPVETEVGHPDEIDEIFDAISYSKGACIIRMLHNWIGDASFRKGLNIYLMKHAYKNATTENLWHAFAEASGSPVRDVMKSWTKQLGYPVLSVQMVSRTDDTMTIEIEQKRFCSSGNDDVYKDVLWLIPISISTSQCPHKPVTTFLMEERSIEAVVENFSSDEWLKLNPGVYGFYRVTYSQSILSLLLQAVQKKSIDARDRLIVQSDIFATICSGQLPATEYLATLEAYTDEVDYSVWSDIRDNLSSLSILLWNGDESDRKRLQKFIIRLFGNIFKRLGWDPKVNESHLDTILRPLVIEMLVNCDSAVVIDKLHECFSKHLYNSRDLDANLRSPCYTAVMTHGTLRDFDTLMELHEKTDLHEEKNRIEICMSATKDPQLIREVLRFAMSEKVRDSDRIFVISSLATAHVEGRDAAWKFTKENWTRLHKLYKGQSLLAHIIKNTASNFCSEEKFHEIERFFKSHPAEAAERTIQQSLENITQKIRWWERDGKAVCDWLKENGY